jgi:hypothetical protein
MPATLDGLIRKGYKFVTVSQLIAMNKPKPSPSPVAKSAAEHANSPKSAKIGEGGEASDVHAQGGEHVEETPSPTPASAVKLQ